MLKRIYKKHSDITARQSLSDREVTPLPFTPHPDDEPINIGVICTGGGSHGAFGAGVLEAILPTINHLANKVEFSGTSAGIINAIAAGSGLNHSGVDEAIRRLRKTWAIIPASSLPFNRAARFLTDAFLPQNQRWPNIPSTPISMIRTFQSFMPSMTAQYISLLAKAIAPNWKAEVQHGKVQISANTVLEHPNAPGTFENVILTRDDLTPDGAAASTNIKHFGVHYIRDVANQKLRGRRAYDGAYQENGPMPAQIMSDATDLIMIVLHDRRHNKLDGNSDLKHAEIHSHALNLAASDTHSPVRLHAIEIESLDGEIAGLSHMDDSSKMNTDEEFINALYNAGLKAGREWLKKNAEYIGVMSTYQFYEPALNRFAEASYA